MLRAEGIRRVIPLGVDQEIPALFIQIMENFFGIKLDADAPSTRQWQDALDLAYLLFSA